MADFFRTVLFIPTLISSIAMIIMFKYFVAYGIPEFLMNTLNVPPEKVPNFFMDTDVAFPMMIFFGIWTGVAGGMVIYMSSMSRIPESLIEYGKLEGISLMKEFVLVILPLIYPTITMFLVTGLRGLFMSSGSVYAFYEDKAPTKLQTLGYYLFTRVIGTNASLQQYPYASAIGVVCALATAPIILFSKWFLEKFDPNVEF
jgi:ABC-type sugar transport system permease subunit